MIETDYEKEYNDCKAKMDIEQSACKQLDMLRECVVRLNQAKKTYWQRPCLSNWPCFFTQHRSEIEKLKETLSPMEKRLIRECEKQSWVDMYKETVGQESTANSANHNTLISNHGNGPVVYRPNLNFPKPTV